MINKDSISEFAQYRDEAHMKYEIIRPVLLGHTTSRDRAQKLKIHEITLAKYIGRFRKDGYAGLLDQRHGPSSRKGELTEAQQAHLIMLRIAYNGFSLRELATIIGQEYSRTIDYKTVFGVLKRYEWLFTYSHSEKATEHLLVRFREYHEYTPIVAGRYRIIELLEAGWKKSTICKVMKVSRHLVYYWQQRFEAEGVIGLYNRPPIRIHFQEIISVANIAFIFETIENNPRIGHYRVKMMLNGQGNIIGHTTIWQIIRLFRDVKKAEKKNRLKMPDEKPLEASFPHEIWFCDIRYLVKHRGSWVYSIIFMDGYSRMIIAGAACLKQDLSHVIAIMQRALMQYGCPKQIVSDNGPVFKAHLLERAIDGLGIDWQHIEKGKPWQNLMESHFSIENRLLDSYIKACTELKDIQFQHGIFIGEYNHSGHWHHKAYTEDGRIYYKTPYDVMGTSRGAEYTSQELSKTFAFKYCQRVVSHKGQIRIFGYILYVDEGLLGESVDVYLYPECLQVEHNGQIIVEYDCNYDILTGQLETVKSEMTFWRESVSKQLFMFSCELYRMVVFRMFRRLSAKVDHAKQLRFRFLESSPMYQ
jgi:putative transposase